MAWIRLVWIWHHSAKSAHFAYLQNLAECPVWPQILNQALGDQDRVLNKSCRAHPGLSGSLLITLIREVWAKLQQFEFRSMHGVHGGTDLHGECSDAHAS